MADVNRRALSLCLRSRRNDGRAFADRRHNRSSHPEQSEGSGLFSIPLSSLVNTCVESRIVSCPAIVGGDLIEEIMRQNLFIAAFLVTVPALYAAESGHSSPSVQGIVARVQKQRVYSPDSTIGGSNPSDAPLTSHYFAYEVSVRVDCKTYVGRYETPFNYLPSALTPDRPIQVRLTKHVMYFDLPNDPDVRMGIVRRRGECGRNR